MANFVVLKGADQYKVFDFDGNVARVGSGEHVDLRLDDTGTDSDIFLLMLTDKGYDLQPVAPGIVISVNGELADKRVSLPENAKVAFLNYMMIVTYGEAAQTKPPTPAAASAPTPPVEQSTQKPAAPTPPPVEADDRTRPMSTSTPEPPKPAAAPPPPPKPQPPVQAEERATAPGGAQPQPQKPPQPPRQEPPPAPPEPVEAPTVMLHNEPPPKPRQPERPPEPPKPRLEPDYVLVGLSGQHSGKIFPIDTPEFVVGRARECNVVIERDEKGKPLSSISREHFTVVSHDGELTVTDRHSKLRTYVNGKVLEPDQREPVAPEDVISIRTPQGEVKFRLCFADDPNPYPDEGKKFPWLPVMGLVVVIIILAFVLYKFLGTE